MSARSKRNAGVVVSLAAAAAVIAATAMQAGGAGAPSAAGSARLELGRKLVAFGGCNDCHTPFKMTDNGPAPDMERMLSGHPEQLVMPPAPALPPGPWMGVVGATNTAWAGPWGVSFTANLTPDPETGIGTWSEQQFIATLRTGHHLGTGRELLPPMPWQGCAVLSDEELGAIYTYLRSVPPVHNRVPAPIPPAGH